MAMTTRPWILTAGITIAIMLAAPTGAADDSSQPQGWRTGDPHEEGEHGNPHAEGETGNPHNPPEADDPSEPEPPADPCASTSDDLTSVYASAGGEGSAPCAAFTLQGVAGCDQRLIGAQVHGSCWLA
jgi:hypothetical protein